MAGPSGDAIVVEAVLLGANSVAGCADFSRSWRDPAGVAGGLDAAGRRGLVAFGSASAIAILDPYQCRVIATLAGHGGRVNGVAWVPHPDAHAAAYAIETELVSCASDETVRVWRRATAAAQVDGSAVEQQTWACTAVLRGHAGSVTGVACAVMPNGALVVASVATDCSLRIWIRPSGAADDAWVAVSPWAVRPAGVFEAVAVTVLPGAAAAERGACVSARGGDARACSVLVAAGGVDAKIHLFHLGSAEPPPGDADAEVVGGSDSVHGAPHANAKPLRSGPAAVLVPLLSLTGHTDWVRSLSFSHHAELAAHFGGGGGSGDCGGGGGGKSSAAVVYLASAGQDCKVRLWRIAPSGDPEAGAPATEAGGAADADADEASVDDEDEAPSATSARAPASASAAVQVSHLVALGGRGGTATGGGVATAGRPLAAPAAASSRPAATAGSSSLQRSQRFVIATTGASPTAFDVVLDALLSGHDGWVTSVRWHPAQAAPPGGGGHAPTRLRQPPCLVTASMDKTAALWRPTGAGPRAAARVAGGAAVGSLTTGPQAVANAADADERDAWAGVWRQESRVGGGNALGLLSAGLSPDGGLLVATGFQGAWHAWARERHPFSGGTAAAPPRWLPAVAPSGHFGAVAHVAWEPRGRYLLSAGADCTTRVWGPVVLAPADADARADTAARLPSAAATASADGRAQSWYDIDSDGSVPHTVVSWHEVSRPQIHGYEMVACACIPPSPGGRAPHTLVTAGDEKVLRVFEAPRHFLRTLDAVCGPALAATGYGSGGDGGGSVHERAEFAYVPELGLTNKGVAAATAGDAVRDRLQIDGKDAVQNAHDASAAAARGAAAAGLTAARAARSGGGGGGGGGGGDEDEEEGGERVLAARPSRGEGVGDAADDAPAAVAPRSDADGALADAAGAGTSHTPTPSAAGAGGGWVPPLSSAYGDPSALGLPRPHPPGASPSPQEGDLVQHSRWPETGKLFSHVAEVLALTVNDAGTLIASAAKARDEAGADIVLWDARTLRLLQTLRAHKLSVVALAFAPTAGPLGHVALGGGSDVVFVAAARAAESPTAAAHSDADASSLPSRDVGVPAPGLPEFGYLASVSKDRTVAVWGPSAAAAESGGGRSAWDAATPALPPRYELLATAAAHKRIVWDVSWAPLPPPPSLGGDGAAVFATGARDQAVKLWGLRGEGGAGNNGPLSLTVLATLPPFDASVTAVAFAPVATAVNRPADADARGGPAPAPAPGPPRRPHFAAWLAVGLESGDVTLWRVKGGGDGGWSATGVARVAAPHAHVGAVRSLAWRPPPPSPTQFSDVRGAGTLRSWWGRDAVVAAAQGVDATAGGSPRPLVMQLASGGEDASVRIMRVSLHVESTSHIGRSAQWDAVHARGISR